MNYKMIIGNDIGNGCVKGSIDLDGKIENFDFPSMIAIDGKPKKPISDPQEIEETISSFYEEIELSIESSAVASNMKKYVVGKKALTKDFVREFDVNSSETKADDELSYVLILSSIAARAIRQYYYKEKKLPEENINIDANIALALPINEYVKGEEITYKKQLNGKHICTVYNFETPIIVQISFSADKVIVVPEGAAAQIAIRSLDDKIIKSMIADAKEYGMDIDISCDEIKQTTTFAGIDVGDGTTNFPIFSELNFDRDLSKSINVGHGKLLEEAVEYLEDNYEVSFSSRKDLANFLANEPNENSSKIVKRNYNAIKDIVIEKEDELARTIAKSFNRLLPKSKPDIIYVYGGGAVPLKKSLFNELSKSAKAGMMGEEKIPVLYMSDDISRFLNRDGLFLIANRLS